MNMINKQKTEDRLPNNKNNETLYKTQPLLGWYTANWKSFLKSCCNAMQTMECSIFIVQRNASLEEDILMQWRTTQQKSQCLEMVQLQEECSLIAYFSIYFTRYQYCWASRGRLKKTKRLRQQTDLNAKQRNNKSGMKLLHHTHFGPRMPAFRGDLFLCEDYCTYTQKCNITYYVPFLSSE